MQQLNYCALGSEQARRIKKASSKTTTLIWSACVNKDTDRPRLRWKHTVLPTMSKLGELKKLQARNAA